ncbi:MAG: DNA polymerase III subunit gamma/tau [Bifidobacterium aquikefiri]|uniref:DNA-directed DNA polymerase n=1 Tax=Bifidobacterium aquikefiri TaxID=1653207 RepID=A0A261G4G3_9BIFI|nr:DNA polymerase III subunit gamma/tau [Bifidobacterium aquikefiri]OZG66083.1 DNA polymerase III subunit gamma/tau [Bifidobacterium aquikefiri]
MGLALYRRYRPDTFDAVIGQNQVTVPLSRALDSGKLTHAYLFSGPRGCGKTSCARILARCINCEKGPTSHPCGTCESCRDLATGGPGSIDVVEIDAASHNGVDDARELRERAGFAPARDRYKIFILDEAHMVTSQGFNALLKIVEEPPEHVIFIFATTEPEKVIGTIRSRTHHYPFRLVPPEVMGPYLEQVCEKEQVKPAAGVLRLAMRAGGGSVRDTMSVLDQLMVGAEDGVITHEAASALLGFTPDAMISDSIDAIAQQNGEALYAVIEKVVIGGFDPKRFVEDLLSRIRDLLVVAVSGSKAQSVLELDDGNESFSQLQHQSASLGLHALNDIADAINMTLSNMNGAISPRMRLELLAARVLAMRADELHPQTKAQAIATNKVLQHAGQRDNAHRQSSMPRNGAGFIGSERRAEGTASSPAAISETPVKNESRGTEVENSGRTRNASDADNAGNVGNANAADGNANSIESDDGARAGSTNAVNDAERTGESDEVQSATAAETKIMNNASPDERWDAVVTSLPSDVRAYVSRDKVPTVAVIDAPQGRKRLLMTFNVPLSQHAFALAVSRESVHGQTSVPKIVMHAVQEAFDSETMIFPSGLAANGEKVASTRRMSPEQVANVKRQIALQKAGLSASNLGSAINKPLAHSRSAQHTKHVALPDMNDSVDPWAPKNVASSSLAPSQTGPADTEQPDTINADPAGSDKVESGTARPDLGRSDSVQSQSANQRDQPPKTQTRSVHHVQQLAARTAVLQRETPIDPSQDTYSMDDPALNTDQSLKLDDIKQLFNVKKIEEFAADDPQNPRNIQQRRNSQQHAQGND